MQHRLQLPQQHGLPQHAEHFQAGQRHHLPYGTVQLQWQLTVQGHRADPARGAGAMQELQTLQRPVAHITQDQVHTARPMELHPCLFCGAGVQYLAHPQPMQHVGERVTLKPLIVQHQHPGSVHRPKTH
ncbi:hypothetical protein D3C80_1255740 [compost metagenome]